MISGASTSKVFDISLEKESGSLLTVPI